MNVEVVGILDGEAVKDRERNRRVYSVYGLSPTIITSGGGGHIPKIMVVKHE